MLSVIFVSTVNKKCVTMHRVVTGAMTGQLVDHINMDRVDNRQKNLRLCTKSQNGANRRRNSNKNTKYKGVYKQANCVTYKSVIRVNGKNIHLGGYKTQEEAAKAYNKAAKELFGDFALLNVI